VLARRPPSNRMAPILVGLVALVMLGGAATAWVVMGKRSGAEAALAASSAASASAVPTEAAADTGSAAPSAAPADTGSAAPNAAPADTGSAAPSAEPSAAPSASASADANADQAASIVCDPAECDEIKIDDKVIDTTQPIVVPPGKHTISVFKTGYVTIKESVTVKAGEKLEKTYKLTLRPTGAAVPGPPKPCGKFLKRCK
jgi:nucleoid-associated protein YgaU